MSMRRRVIVTEQTSTMLAAMRRWVPKAGAKATDVRVIARRSLSDIQHEARGSHNHAIEVLSQALKKVTSCALWRATMAWRC
jgi:hypothetical protein